MYNVIFFFVDLQNQQTAFYGLEVNDAISSKINPSFCLKACIEQDRQSLLLFVSEKEPGNHKWLQYGLFPKLKNWLESVGENKNNFNVESLSLINIEEYTSKYNEMKLKYGKRMVEVCNRYFLQIETTFEIVSYTFLLRYGLRQLTRKSTFTRMWRSLPICSFYGKRKGSDENRRNYSHLLIWAVEMVYSYTF